MRTFPDFGLMGTIVIAYIWLLVKGSNWSTFNFGIVQGYVCMVIFRRF